MDRRSLLKIMSLSTVGCAISTPTLIQLLSSCNSDKNKQWKPLFLSDSQAFMVEQLSDLILPSSKTPGALDIHTPQFIDLILNDILPKKEQDIFVKGAFIFEEKFKNMFDKEVEKGFREEYNIILEIYFNLTPETQKQVFELMKQDAKKTRQKEIYYIYKFLIFIREYTLLGFYSSKQVGTEILNYTPIPGYYESCVPVTEVGNISSI
ncbi:gluconate 2-dehydrogenase subunit 3 family protein [Flavicella sp.]|uniref:gluconate 2-dehydrogenase subunit 3 family protein n=1 Tax=Flavicella sp. TaxID=2957742 RepID=UPI00301A799B